MEKKRERKTRKEREHIDKERERTHRQGKRENT